MVPAGTQITKGLELVVSLITILTFNMTDSVSLRQLRSIINIFFCPCFFYFHSANIFGKIGCFLQARYESFREICVMRTP